MHQKNDQTPNKLFEPVISAVRHIDHINIVAHDLPQMVSFFKQLGFEVVAEAPLEGSWISEVVGLPEVIAEYAALKLPYGQTAIEVIRYHRPETPIDDDISQPHAQGYRHIALAVSDIEEIRTQLEQQSVHFVSRIMDYTTKRLCYLHGPEGLLIELAEYFDFPANS